MKNIFNIAFLLVFNIASFSHLMCQDYRLVTYPFYNDLGETLRNAMAGGLNVPQFSTVDLNNDGIQDLVVFDRSGSAVLPFLNGGTAYEVDYHYAPEYISRFPSEASFVMLLRDYNCDAIADIFALHWYAFGWKLGVWQGSYDANNKIQFQLVKNELIYCCDPMGFSGAVAPQHLDIPAIGDIDGDGDIDILFFGTGFASATDNVIFCRNNSQENGSGCDSLNFVLEHSCWGMFTESSTANGIYLSPGVDSCANNPFWQQRDPRHGAGSTITDINYNGDAFTDVIIGDAGYPTMVMVTMNEQNDTAWAVGQSVDFPLYNYSIDIEMFPAAYFFDANNDGLTDMVAAINADYYYRASGCTEATDSMVWYYQNTLSNSNMFFDKQNEQFLLDEMVDIGAGNAPAFFDYNADGLLDIVMGNFGKCHGGISYGQLYLFENIGTPSSPAFQLIDRNYLNAAQLQIGYLHPCFGDIDGDGDVDMFLGQTDGSLIFYENVAGAGIPAAFANPQLNYAMINVGLESAPQLVDLDRDGDLDLVLGANSGRTYFFENTGTAAAPSFSNIASSNTLAGIDLNTMASGSGVPYFVEIDSVYQLFMGHRSGTIIHMGNIENNIFGSYDTLSLAFADWRFGAYTAFCAADLDGNDSLEFMIGNGRGGISIYKNYGQLITDIVNTTQQTIDFRIYPNPATALLNIEMEGNSMDYNCIIYNNLSQVISDSKHNSGFAQIDIRDLHSGLYFVEIWQGGHRVGVKKWIKM